MIPERHPDPEHWRKLKQYLLKVGGEQFYLDLINTCDGLKRQYGEETVSQCALFRLLDGQEEIPAAKLFDLPQNEVQNYLVGKVKETLGV